jgi:DNA topoisomerase I
VAINRTNYIDKHKVGIMAAAGKKKLVIVESPTKAKTIRKYLGKDYIVESCMGHIRDLPKSAKDIPEKYKKKEWSHLGVNVDDNFDPIYCVPKDKLKVVKGLKDKLEDASELFLATDEDREGESISWHLQEVLKPNVPTKRMVFHEITKEAILKALKDTRKIDMNLVRAQEARRILDRLVGYTISPLLWKKVAYGLSAGRVQSVAVRLISERELQRVKFKKSSYWGLVAQFEKQGVPFEARLTWLKSSKVATGKDFSDETGLLTNPKDIHHLQESEAREIAKKIQTQDFTVTEVEEKPVARKPYAPFITSTLQQESNRKLGLGSRETMQIAQKLYENGLITYMRTDSTFLSTEAIGAARDCISRKYGKEYLPSSPRTYEGKKAKGAQEAHEAIRPAGTQFIDPDESGLVGLQLKLYELIWMRTVASQMVDARQKQVSVKISGADKTIFNANGMTIEFPGFLRAYVEGSDDPEADLSDREVRLPQLKQNENLKSKNCEPTSHETKPPARFTEASLVQIMEKEGIGRPSTYASIISTIIDRGYVKKMGSALAPTFTAMVVSRLLSENLPQYVDLGFTSQMEKSLDDVADGDLDSDNYLKEVYFGKTGLKYLVESQEKKIDPEKARSMSLPGFEKFSFRVGKYGAYVCTKKDGKEFCASLPESESPADLTPESATKLIDQKINGADSLGLDPISNKKIYVLSGRYGPYVQLGENESEDESEKPKRVSIPTGMDPAQLKIQQCLDLLTLPKSLGEHPQTKKDIKAGLGRFGPFVVCDGDYRSIPKTESIFTVTLERALELFAQPKKGRGRAAAIKSLGLHPQIKEEVSIYNGPYGPYIKVAKINVSLPEGETVESMTLEKSLELIATKYDATEVKEKTAPKKKKKAKTKAPAKAEPKSETKAKPVVKVKRSGTKNATAAS